MRQLTRHEVVVTGGRGDGGVDIEIRSEKTLVGIVQCKQYDERTSLAPSHIRELAAVKAKRAVQIAYLVTTARFSKAAKTEAEELGVSCRRRAVKCGRGAVGKAFGQTLD
ncbi:MAG: restriction endonuclease [Chloroflexi bacterium]|nr:restriction endonuclease [Chloroflexota bacterium]